VPNSVQTKTSLTDAWNCEAQEPDYADTCSLTIIPDRRTGPRHWIHVGLCALDKFWRDTVSSLWQTDRSSCLREATSATNVHNSER